MLDEESPEELIFLNRAWPREEELTLPALLRRFASPAACQSFRFEPGDRIERDHEAGTMRVI